LTAEAYAQEVVRYDEMIDTVLLDLSGGRGRRFNQAQAGLYLKALLAAGYRGGIGVAGGLRPGNLTELLPGLLAICEALSWDAEGGLRDPEDRLDIEVAREYVAQSYALLASESGPA
jgi:hypothetical protein